MSKYTTEIRFICESALSLRTQGNYNNIDDAIQAGRFKLFSFDYDLFDPEYKSVIETKFLRHYYLREIGFETVAIFKLKLQDRIEMILPYYNKLWESETLKFNPFHDVDYSIDHKGSGSVDRKDDNLKSSNSQLTNTSKRDGSNETHDDFVGKYSDTPQGGLDGVIDTDWLTNARVDKTDKNGSWEDEAIQSGIGFTNESGKLISDVHTTDDYLRKVVGKMGTKNYSELLKEYRSTFLNIDKKFIEEFKDLFMLIY